jgi:hypothetical protein
MNLLKTMFEEYQSFEVKPRFQELYCDYTKITDVEAEYIRKMNFRALHVRYAQYAQPGVNITQLPSNIIELSVTNISSF